MEISYFTTGCDSLGHWRIVHGSATPHFVTPPAPVCRGSAADLSRRAVEGPAVPLHPKAMRPMDVRPRGTAAKVPSPCRVCVRTPQTNSVPWGRLKVAQDASPGWYRRPGAVPPGTAENAPGRQSGVGLDFEEWVRALRTTSWATFSLPTGLNSGSVSSHTDSGGAQILQMIRPPGPAVGAP